MSSDYELAAVPLQVSPQQWMQPPASFATYSFAVKWRLRGLRSQGKGKSGEQITPRTMNLSHSSLFSIFPTTHSEGYCRYIRA
jgi:hypothetical protein